MAKFVVDLQNLVIANAGTTSGAIGSLDDATWIAIHAPSALTGTVTVQVEPTDAGTTWRDLTAVDGTGDVTIPAGNTVVVRQIGFRQIRLSSSGAEGAERTFNVTKQVEF